MKCIPLLLFAATCCLADPVRLHVESHNDKYLTFQIENQYASPITGFEVEVQFPGTGLRCGFTASVRRAEDLKPDATCGLPASPKVDAQPRWKARIVAADFADGMRWLSKD